MKIGVLTSVGLTIDKFFPPLIDRWEELGHEVATAASTSSKFSEHTVIKSVTRNPSMRNLRAPIEIAAWVKELEIDVLVTNTATASFLGRLRRLPVPVIYFCHGLHWNEVSGLRNRFWQTLEHFALRNTDAVMVINHDDENWITQRFRCRDVHRLLGGVGVPISEYPRSPIPIVEDIVHLLWAGEFSERKRPWLTVETISALLEENLPVHLTMCGDGPLLSQTRELVEKLNIEHAVSLVGSKPNISDFLFESHALLMTSAWEGLPRIGLEAIATGRPVFAFDVKGTRSLPGVVLAPEQDVSELARLICKHVQSSFSSIDFIDPMQLHPNHAADEIISVAQELIDKVST